MPSPQTWFTTRKCFAQGVDGNANFFCDNVFVARDVKDVALLEVAVLAYVVVRTENARVVIAKHSNNFLRRPEVKLPFLAFTVGVLSCVEAALRVEHLAGNVIEGLGS